MKEAAIVLQKYIRRYNAIREARRRRKAANTIKRFIKGFITRNGEPTDENRDFLCLAKVQWLNRLARSLPKDILHRKPWPPSPYVCREASSQLENMYGTHLSRVYRLKLTPEMKRQFELKVLAEQLFKDKKKSYTASIAHLFVFDRVPETSLALKQGYTTTLNGDKEVYSSNVIKYDRHGYKPRERVIIISKQNLHVNARLKHCLPLKELSFIVSPENDRLLLIQIPENLIKKDKGDLILEVPHLIEAVTMIMDIVKNPKALTIIGKSQIEHNMKGKQGTIDIQVGNPERIHKDKSGHLLIASRLFLLEQVKD
ncbi:hypothetical protein NQ317_003406 [Molorchus minor]|uniref:TH1 domain-containing protein n=1 Tax=Molorchus minor TaxID=1323400 RepID=A0ABQ9JTN1_9CUCU|nr:hypothetical protein NQ317_003406 [Molorchus minor]